ncbi:MAG: hypothetical protein ACOCV2_09730 [Persicimonas sp.]
MTRPTIRTAFVLLVSLSLLVACQRRDDPEPVEQPGDEQVEDEAGEKAEDGDRRAKKDEKHAKKKKKQIAKSSEIPGTENQLTWDDDVPEVDFELTAPEEDQVLESGDEVAIEFDLSDYRIGKEIGQHIHVIVDNEPYIAHYEDGEAVVVEDLEPGTHTIRAFPSRHYHLSLKEDGAYDAVTFHVEEESEEFDFDPDEPYITYSRPKGTYSSEGAEELLLDFYVSNVELGDDARVVYEVDGEKEGELEEWEPILMPPLEPGEHEVRLRLVDGDGELIENGGYNDTTRTITVKE